jgi:hypothetical protein
MIAQIAGASPRLKAKVAGVAYLLTFVMGVVSLVARGRLGVAANLVSTACYVAVVVLLYDIFKPVNRILSLLAAIVGLVGCTVGALSLFSLAPFGVHVHPLVFFGFYCLLIGYLIVVSTFLPRTLGALMAFAGLGWLTFLSPPFASSLQPYNMAPGMLGEAALMLWLIVRGVNIQRWQAQTAAAANGP